MAHPEQREIPLHKIKNINKKITYCNQQEESRSNLNPKNIFMYIIKNVSSNPKSCDMLTSVKLTNLHLDIFYVKDYIVLCKNTKPSAHPTCKHKHAK